MTKLFELREKFQRKIPTTDNSISIKNE